MNLPESKEAERAVLAAIILDSSGKHMATAANHLLPEDFHSPFHRKLFGVMLGLHKTGTTPDEVILLEALNSEEDPPPPEQFFGVLEGFPYRPHIANYISLLKQKTAARKKIILGARLTEGKVEIAEAKKALDEIGQIGQDGPTLTMSEVMLETMELLQKQANGEIRAIPTPFSSLNDLINGWEEGSLHILAARPSVGKTTFAIQSAIFAGQKGYKSIFLSLEMPRAKICQKMLACLADLNPKALEHKQGQKTAGKYIEKVSSLPILIDDYPSFTVEQIFAKVQKIQAQKKMDLLIVDHAQLIKASKLGRSNTTRAEELSHISRALKIMAKLCQMPVVLLCQLNRDIEKRVGQEPLLSDLKESGSFEQDADQVIFITRKEVFKAVPGSEDKAEIFVSKNRMGQTGKIELAFNRKLARFV